MGDLLFWLSQDSFCHGLILIAVVFIVCVSIADIFKAVFCRCPKPEEIEKRED